MRITTTRIAFLLAVAVGLFFLFGPVYTGDTGGRISHKSLLEMNGPKALVAVGIPIFLTALPLVVPRLRIAAAAMLSFFAVLAGFSIGLFYIPAAILLWWPERSVVE